MMLKLKNKIVILVIFIMSIFFINSTNVYAAIDWQGVVIECIYSDGSLFEYSYNEYSSKWNTNKYTYNLKGVDSVENTTSSTVIYSATHGTPTENNKCIPYMTKSIVSSKEDDEEGQTTTYIKFTTSDHNNYTDFNDNDFGETWADYFWFWQKPTAETANKGKKTYNLVSENYILTDKAGEPDEIFNYKREDKLAEGEVTQAIAKPEYITILDFGNVYLAQSQEKITTVEDWVGTKPEVLYFNNADPKSYSGNNGTVAYYFENIRINSKTQSAYNNLSDSSKANFQRYVYNGAGNPNDAADTGELCTKIMPNTAKDLARIIGIIQLAVPALLILLIGLDLGKIIMSGNLDEEIPKQKRSIIIRLISAVVIFFLPLILQLLLTTVKIDSGSTDQEISAIQSIKCIIDMVGRV